MTARSLVVTIDTEVDKDPAWRVSEPATFRSVVEGIPGVLSPLFDRYGVKPTYLLSAEVIEEPECVAVLKGLGDRAELGTHLHAEFVEPGRRLWRADMAGRSADAIQAQDPPDVEAAKLANLTGLFRDAFGRAPTSFRAGRYGMSGATLGILASLGYRVDSSVTPGLRWDYKEGVVDHRGWGVGPRWVGTPAGPILEVPLSVRPASRLAEVVRDWPAPLRKAARGVAGRRVRYDWLRPSWASGLDLARYVVESRETYLNLMFHSMEVVPGASPYARTPGDVGRIVDSLEHLFARCAEAGIGSRGLTDVSCDPDLVGSGVEAVARG